MSKYDAAFEKIVAYEINLAEWTEMMKRFADGSKLTIGDILDGNLSDEMMLVYDAIEKAALYDALQNKTPEPKADEPKEQSDRKLGERCPHCASDRTFIISDFLFAMKSEEYLDADGNLCRTSNGGASTIKCYKCGQIWKQTLPPRKVIVKPYVAARSKRKIG